MEFQLTPGFVFVMPYNFHRTLGHIPTTKELKARHKKWTVCKWKPKRKKRQNA